MTLRGGGRCERVEKGVDVMVVELRERVASGFPPCGSSITSRLLAN